jgi:hypothetical protein
MAIVVPLLAEWNPAGLNRALRDIDRAEGGFAKAGVAIDRWLKPALAGAAIGAGALAVKLGVDSVKAALEDEQAVAKLGQTLENVGFSARQREVEGFITSLQAATGVADTEMRPAFDRLLRSTKDVGEAERALELALDVAAGKGKSLEAVANALGKAYDGNTNALGRLGLGLETATLKSGDMDKVTSDLTSLFRGQASTASDTYQGRLDKLAVVADEAKETIGYALLGAIEDVTDAMGGTGGAEDAAGQLARGFAGLIEQTGQAVAAIVDFVNESENLGEQEAARQAVSEQGWRQLVQLIPIAGSYMAGLSARHEDAAAAAWTNERAVAALASRYQAMGAAAAVAADAQAAAQVQRASDAWAARYTAQARDLGRTVSFTGGNLREYMAALNRVNTSLGGGGGGGGGGGTAGALDKVNPKLQKQLDLIGRHIDALDAQRDKLDELVEASNDYAESITSALTNGIDLGAAMDAAGTKDAQGYLAAFTAQLADTRAFTASLGQLATGLGNTPGARELISQIAGLGPTAGLELLKGLTTETAAGMAADLAATLAAAEAGGFGISSVYHGQGILAATAMLDGMSEQLEADEKKLRKIGRAIGQPIGAEIKAAIAEAISEAVSSGNAARAAARSTYNVTVQAGIGNPVAIAREVEAVLATRAVRLGAVP